MKNLKNLSSYLGNDRGMRKNFSPRSRKRVTSQTSGSPYHALISYQILHLNCPEYSYPGAARAGGPPLLSLLIPLVLWGGCAVWWAPDRIPPLTTAPDPAHPPPLFINSKSLKREYRLDRGMIATAVISMIGRGISEIRSNIPRSSETLNFTRYFSSNFYHIKKLLLAS